MSFEWTILLVDDEQDIRDVISLTLQDAGYKVIDAPDGETGLKLCETERPQIVITDIRMPGISGLELLEIIKQKFPEIEVVVITAFGEIEFAIRALQLDASDFVTKPINDKALHIALNRAAQRYTSRKQVKDYTQLLEKEKAATTQELLATISFKTNLIESSMDGILGCDETDLVVIFNKSMEQMVGFSKGEVVNKMTLGQFFQPGEAARLKSELEGEKYGGKHRLSFFETTLLGCSGRMIPVQVSAIMLFEQNRSEMSIKKDFNKKNGVVCFFRDLREIRKLEREKDDQAQILHQDKMMALGKLAASMVHEINNPLTGILNYSRLMMRILSRGALTQEHQQKFERYLELVESETNRCSEIVSSLLTFSRKSPPSFGEVRSDELLHRCIILSQHKLELNNIKLVSRISPDIPPINGDFNQLQQSLINLIFNAVDAMPDGGTLELYAGYDLRDKTVTISVRDTGIGISKENISRIFEPFFTTKSKEYGVGLGLSTVYGIIERHNGKVCVESRVGEGSVFRLIFNCI
ncbi:MAG: response regulator [Desulfamplus sp.]|nr:response regulator [Desulfamplus sp.]